MPKEAGDLQISEILKDYLRMARSRANWYLDNPLAVDEQVARLDVPVNALFLLQVGQC